MPFWEDDLDTMFDEFAVDATFTAGANIGKVIPVLFDEDAKDYNSVAGVVTATGPEIRVKTSDVELHTLKKGDTLSIDGKTWTIASPARNFEPGIKIFKMQRA